MMRLVIYLVEWLFPPSSATERGERLLISWLTPEQADSYKEHGCFTVIGCDSGARYIIRRHLPYSVCRSASNGWYCYFCFAPHGVGVIEDQLLAQKIALENFESTALRHANGIQTCETPVRHYGRQG